MKNTKKTDFTAELGEVRKRKFQLISKRNNRSMTGQLKYWIDHSPFGSVELTPEEAFVRQREDGAACVGLAAETEGKVIA